MDYEQHFKDCGYELYPHQLKGLKFMENKERNGTGGILADDVGLGKTIQIIALLYTRPGNTLIACPPGVAPQWMEKLNTLLPEDKYEIVPYYSQKEKKHTNIQEITQKCEDEDRILVVVTTHGQIALNSCSFLQVEVWDRVVVDEAHFLRNPATKLFLNCKRLFALYKWMLTATPVQNKANDLYSLLYIACGMKGQTKLGKKKGISEIVRLRNQFVLRRCKHEILHKLPPLEIENMSCKFISNAEQDFYHKLEKHTTEEFKEAMKRKNVNYMIAVLEMLLRLRQCSFHPQLVIDGYKKKGWFRDDLQEWTGVTTKLHYLEKTVLKELKDDPTQHTLIFCQFHAEMEMIQNMLCGHGFTTFIYCGKTRIDARADVATGLLRPQFLIIQIRAGGAGLNLQMYNRVFFTSLDWNPSNEFQAIGRAHRSGQRKPVKVTRLLLEWNDAYAEKLAGIREQLTQMDTRIEKKKAKLEKTRAKRTNQEKKTQAQIVATTEVIGGNKAIVPVVDYTQQIIDLQAEIRELKQRKTVIEDKHKMHTIDHRIFQIQNEKTDIQVDVLDDRYLKQVHNYKIRGTVTMNLNQKDFNNLLG
jgi:SNF2 family DNA or RNA helicase